MSDLAVRLGGDRLDGLSPEAAQALSAIARGARAHPPIGESAQTKRLERLAGAGAWAEAALALVSLVAPDWQVRRLELDGGEWWCTLSRHPRTPREFDDAVDGRDTLLALAILDALQEARQRASAQRGEGGRAAAEGRSETSEIVWCDNAF